MSVSININAVILEATFNQLDNQMVKKTSMGAEILQRATLFAGNVLSDQHATRRSEHVPKELNAPRGKVAARVPGAVRVGTRERIVQTHASIMVRTDLPVKGQIFHREAENRLFRRPREAKKLNFKCILNAF